MFYLTQLKQEIAFYNITCGAKFKARQKIVVESEQLEFQSDQHQSNIGTKNVWPNPALARWLSNKCLFSLALGKTLCFATTTLVDAATNFKARP